MKFSFITCTYNRSELLEKNINSVLNQKFENYEHFIVDDGSTDNTEKIIRKYNHIKYIRLKRNYGQPGAMFNSKVLNKISGDYVVLLDSDDYLINGAKKEINKVINKNNDKNIWSFSFNIISKNRKKLNFNKKIIDSNSLYKDNHPRYNNGKGYLDFLDIRKKIFYDKFKHNFKNSKYWYSSFPEVYFKNKFKEVIVSKKIVFYSFAINNVTQGANFEKYAPITLHSQQYIFNNFKQFMGKKYYDYNLKSLIMNQLIFPGYKFANFKLINTERKNFLKQNDYFLLLLLLIVPSIFLFFIKKIIKKIRKFR